MAQQTAVEWLVDKVTDMVHESNHIELVSLLEQTKQIEKEQVEISDEEIDKIAKEFVLYNESKRNWVIEGMKLYREQLKNK